MSKKFLIAIIFIPISVAGIVLAIYNISKPIDQSEEGHLMIEACEDIKAYEIFRVENDFDEIINVINKHVKMEDNKSFYEETIDKLKFLENEVVFRNIDEEMYRNGFSTILNKLCHIELINSVTYLENNNQEELMVSLKNAKHYLHDAMIFSNGDLLEKELQLLRNINLINKDDISITDLQTYVDMAMKISKNEYN